MARDQFLMLLTFLHPNDNNFIERGREGFDDLFKLRPFLNALRGKCLSVFFPGQNLALDEAMVAWKGALLFQVFNPNKPDKFGIKSFWGVHPSTGYCSNFEVYIAKGQASQKEATHDLSMHLLDPLLDVGQRLYINNYYTSPVLFTYLEGKKINACGNLCLNHDGIPSQMKEKKLVKNPRNT